MAASPERVAKVILIPALITLAVTLLRLTGELLQWNETLFNRTAGGGGSIVGISWLALILAVYFAVKLQNQGQMFQRTGRTLGIGAAALVTLILGLMLMVGQASFRYSVGQAAGLLVSALSLLIMRAAWRPYWNVLLAYALAARIPVIIVMYLAFRGKWGTHYDALPPNVVFESEATKFIQLGLFPQLFFWIPFTVVFCGLIGIGVVAIRKWLAAEKVRIDPL